ncbi:MAG: Stp1/IreP family PP2C-type Ser/Thr phosphatase [Ignavibacteriaceae bacterium]
MKFHYTSLSKVGLKRVENEDAVGVFRTEGGLLCILCDGLGGSNAGSIASKMTVDTILNSFSSNNRGDYLERLKYSVRDTNAEIYKIAEDNQSHKGMATTVEVLFLKDNFAYWAHIGDSRIYLYRNNRLKQLTKDHSLIQKLIDEGYLTIKDAINHPNKNIVLKALGEKKTVNADFSKLKISSSESWKFFLCSDGVTTVITDNELSDILSKNDINENSRELSILIEKRGAPDNFSFVIIENEN